jgi:hypothetical protein
MYTIKKGDLQRQKKFDLTRQYILKLCVVRIITQMLLGLMLFFGVITLAPRVFLYARKGNIVRTLYFLLLVAAAFFFSMMAFYFAYWGMREL